MSRLALVALGLACAGCATQSSSGERVVGRYLGLVEVTTPAPAPGRQADVMRRQVKVLGGWLETSPRTGGVESAGLGWRDSRQLVVPMDCRLVVIVRSAEELESARATLGADRIAKGELCVVPE